MTTKTIQTYSGSYFVDDFPRVYQEFMSALNLVLNFTPKVFEFYVAFSVFLLAWLGRRVPQMYTIDFPPQMLWPVCN
jgi:hypothetical protein